MKKERKVYDIVIPNKNEKEFIEIAERLGYDGLCFLYDLKNYRKYDENDHNIYKTKLNIFHGVICRANEVRKARGISNIVMVYSTGEDRSAIEQFRPDLMTGFEHVSEKDFIHQRASGLNQVLVKMMKKNNMAMLVGFSDLKLEVMSRIKQNLVLFRKYKSPFVIASLARKPLEMRNHSDIISLFVTQGFQTGFIAKGFGEIVNVYNRNKKMKSPDYICEGVELVE